MAWYCRPVAVSADPHTARAMAEPSASASTSRRLSLLSEKKGSPPSCRIRSATVTCCLPCWPNSGHRLATVLE
jgi:hypothetical protein